MTSSSICCHLFVESMSFFNYECAVQAPRQSYYSTEYHRTNKEHHTLCDLKPVSVGKFVGTAGPSLPEFTSITSFVKPLNFMSDLMSMPK